MQKITQVGVLSFAKVMGMTGVLIGLIIGVLYGSILIMLALVGADLRPMAGGLATFGIGALAIIVLAPIFYGIASFIGGLIYTLIINLVLKKAGGLELEIQNWQGYERA